MPSHEEYLDRLASAESAGKISPSAVINIRRWLTQASFKPYLETLQSEIDAGRWTELDNAFYEVLEFGTGGRRGRMYPVGTNVLNDRTIAESARGLADWVIGKKGAGAAKSCVIAYDTRHNSRHFSELAPGAGGGGVHGSPVRGAAVDALVVDGGAVAGV